MCGMPLCLAGRHFYNDFLTLPLLGKTHFLTSVASLFLPTSFVHALAFPHTDPISLLSAEWTVTEDSNFQKGSNFLDSKIHFVLFPAGFLAHSLTFSKYKISVL